MPAQTLRANLAGWAPLLPPGALLVSLMKGIELGTCKRMSEVISEVRGRGRRTRVAVVSGPNLAREIAGAQFAATVVACADDAAADRLQQGAATPAYFRPYTNTDVIGCELGGTVKNVIALAVGIAVAMGLGDNTRATLITRGLAEIARLGAALGARPADVRRAGRDGRPGGHLQLAAVPQPDVRRVPGPGHDGGRGRCAMTTQTAEGVNSSQSGARTGPPARRGDADHRGDGRGHAPWPGSRQGGRPADQPFGEARALRRLRSSVNEQRKIRVAVVFGGRGPEHAVSCMGGGNMLGAIDRDKYEVVPVGITRDGSWVLAADDPARLAVTAGQLPSVEAVAEPGTQVVPWAEPGPAPTQRPRPDTAPARRR